MTLVTKTIKQDYQLALRTLKQAQVPFVIGGAWALEHYLRLGRATIDLDLMIEPSLIDPAIGAFVGTGAKVLEQDVTEDRLCLREAEVDLVHHFAQGEYAVDASFYRRGRPGRLFDVAVSVAAPEDLLWTKMFVAARHRFDGADVVHLMRATGEKLDWHLLKEYFAPYPELLLAYLNLFQFIYPNNWQLVPSWLMEDLMAGFAAPSEPSSTRICRGTLIDRSSFVFDIVSGGYEDARES
ncbi:MAG TPA: hypothetical protein VMW65_18760 [Chloroflexota bacterium]|nr:hypothetical protein [Chloroflexota bacterium]